jgi:hypothetical protein
MSNGGWTPWRDSVEEHGDSNARYKFKQVTFGRDNSRNYKMLNKSGWRNKGVTLTKVADILEGWAELEKEWQKVPKGAESEAEEMQWSKSTAEAALIAYENELQTSGPFIDVQNDEARVHHKRARQQENELAIECGDSLTAPIETGIYRIQLKHQVQEINQSASDVASRG